MATNWLDRLQVRHIAHQSFSWPLVFKFWVQIRLLEHFSGSLKKSTTRVVPLDVMDSTRSLETKMALCYNSKLLNIKCKTRCYDDDDDYSLDYDNCFKPDTESSIFNGTGLSGSPRSPPRACRLRWLCRNKIGNSQKTMIFGISDVRWMWS